MLYTLIIIPPLCLALSMLGYCLSLGTLWFLLFVIPLGLFSGLTGYALVCKLEVQKGFFEWMNKD